MNKHFTIIIPVYNAEKFVRASVLSALTQNYDNFDIMITDDASTDKTNEIIKETIAKFEKKSKAKNIKLIENNENMKPLYNINNMIRQSDDETIIVILDGDDRLFNNNILNKLNDVYSEYNGVWMTCGSYIQDYNVLDRNENSAPYDYIIDFKTFRKSDNWPLIHLRTFYRKLYMHIKDEDLKDDDGKFYSCSCDRAIMYPMAEMSGNDHYCQILDILYVYTFTNEISEHIIYRENQLSISEKIKNKTPYDLLENL